MSGTVFDTILPADSIEFCPHPEADDYFVCGTYKLHQPEAEASDGQNTLEFVAESGGHQKRTGKCLLFKVNPDDSTDLYVFGFSLYGIVS